MEFDFYLIILRLFHVFGAMIWFGFGVFLTYVSEPTVHMASTDGRKFMDVLARRRIFAVMMPAANVITVVSGILLYIDISAGFNASWMESSSGIVLSLGSITGILAFIVGGALHGPITRERAQLAMAFENSDPTDEQLKQLEALDLRSEQAATYSMTLLVITVVLMVSAEGVF